MIALSYALTGPHVTILNNDAQRAAREMLKELMDAVRQCQLEVVTHRGVRSLRASLVGSISAEASQEAKRRLLNSRRR